MKKSVILLIAIILTVICLVSCECFTKESEHEHEFKYIVYDTGHFKQYTCGCPSPDIMSEHVDGDGDLLCDVCNYVMSVAKDDIEWQYSETHHWHLPDGEVAADVIIGYAEHSDENSDLVCDVCKYAMPGHNHTTESYHDEIGHGWSYTCGCATPPNFAQHFDGNGDDKCDDCPYQMVAEGNHFIRNQAGAEWLCQITADDIAEIKMISGGGGPLPPVSFTHISSSRNKAVISSIFEEYYWLDSKPVSEEKTQIADGGYFIVQFILNDGTVKKLYFINGDFYHDGKGNYFEIVRLPVFRDGTNFVNHYGFENWNEESCVYLMDGLLVAVIPTGELEFIELTDDIYLGAETPAHYIEMNGEKIYFLKDEYFYIGDDRSTYYQLVGKNLDELIAENAILYD